MDENKPKVSADHPLTKALARKMLIDLAENNTGLSNVRGKQNVSLH